MNKDINSNKNLSNKKNIDLKNATPSKENLLNRNYRKSSKSALDHSLLKKNEDSNSSRIKRIKNAFNSSKNKRVSNMIQEDSLVEDNPEQSIIKSKAEDIVDKKKKQLIGKIAASFFSSNIILLVFGGIIILTILILLLPILISYFTSSFFNYFTDNSSSASMGMDGVIARSGDYGTFSCGSVSDEDFNVSFTSLTEEQFVNALLNGKSRDGYKAYSILKDNARLIYRKGVEMGVNPELAVLRADVEGYSPASAGYTSYNNLWGFGCENGKPLSTCSNFSTFEKGLERFNNWIIKYRSKVSDDSYYSVFHDYASIGSYWNKGSAGSGGCYYKKDVIEQLEKMGEHQRAVEVENACSSGNVIKTNKIDQDAYARYQTKIMLDDRKRIFGISGGNMRSCYGKQINLDVSGIINKRLNNIQNISFAEVLQMNHTSIDIVNNQLLQEVTKVTPGSREAVVTAGMFLVNSLASYNLSLPYMFYGGHDYYGTNGSGVRTTFDSHDYYGINPYFGSLVYNGNKKGVYRDTNGTTYYYNGLDCSGFVGWALHNGGVDFPTLSALDYLDKDKQNTYHLTTSTIKEKKAKIGDVMSKTPHHAALIIGVNYSETNSYIVYLEEVGDGLVVSQKDINDSYLNKFTVINMDYVYENNKTSDFTNKFKSGLIKEG